jgi:hypothetical protein
MFRLFSLVGVAFLAAAAVALTNPTTSKVTRRQPRPAPDDSADSPRLRAALPVAVRARPLYYASFSLN